MARDLLFFLIGDTFDLVCREAEKFEAVRNCGTHIIAVFSDPAGEHQNVHAPEQGYVCTSALGNNLGTNTAEHHAKP